MVPRVRLTGKSARFLQLLLDFGHLDEEDVARALLSLPPPRRRDAAARLELDQARRAAAMVLFQRAEGDEPDGLLAEDWPILFS